MPEKIRLTLDVDVEQLHILLAQLEGMAWEMERDPASLSGEIENAAQRWTPENDNEFDYSIVKIAPVYRVLLNAWLANNQGREDWEARDIIEAENLADMVLALRAARAAVADVPTPPKAPRHR